MRIFGLFFGSLFLLSQTATANEAQDFFEKYNKSDSDVRMICPQQDGSAITLSAKNGAVFLNGGQVAQVTQNGDKEQYFIKGVIWNMFFDFENKLLINILDGEELDRTRCQ